METSELTFAPCPVREKETEATIRVAVMKGGRIKLVISRAAHQRLQLCNALHVETATFGGAHFLRVSPGTPAAKDWPVEARRLGGRKAKPLTQPNLIVCMVNVHPFKIDVTHAAAECQLNWASEAMAVVQMPNWERMADEIDAAAGNGDDEGDEEGDE